MEQHLYILHIANGLYKAVIDCPVSAQEGL